MTYSIADTLNIYFQIFCLFYADDTIILAERAKQLQSALDGLHTNCDRWALKVNIDKTKVVIFFRGKSRNLNLLNLGKTQ